LAGNLLSVQPGAPPALTPLYTKDTLVVYDQDSNGNYTGTDSKIPGRGYVNSAGAHYTKLDRRWIQWAEGIGPATAPVVRDFLERKPHPEMGYLACLGVLRLEKIYSRPRLEAARVLVQTG
jgi:hypothetical protein